VLLGEPGFKVVGFGHPRIMANKTGAGPVRSPERDIKKGLILRPALKESLNQKVSKGPEETTCGN
jgi:hypothetical protein